MSPRTIATLAVSGMLMGSASTVVFWALLGPDGEAPPAATMEGAEFRGSLTPAPLPAAAVGGTAAIEAIGVIKPGLLNGTAGMSLAMSTRVGPTNGAMLEGARPGAAWSSRAREHPTSRAGAKAVVLEPEPDGPTHALKWLPAPPPAKPKLALAGEPDRALERAQENATRGGVQIAHVDQSGAAEALVRLPERSAAPQEAPQANAADAITAFLPAAEWAEALPDAELGDLRGAGVDQVVLEMMGDTTVNDETSNIDATLTLDSNGQATLDGTLPNNLSLEGEGVRVETVLDGMENFSGFAQVVQVPGNNNVVTANLLINMYILMNEGALPPNLANLSAGMLP